MAKKYDINEMQTNVFYGVGMELLYLHFPILEDYSHTIELFESLENGYSIDIAINDFYIIFLLNEFDKTYLIELYDKNNIVSEDFENIEPIYTTFRLNEGKALMNYLDVYNFSINEILTTYEM